MSVPVLNDGKYIVVDPSAEHTAYVCMELKDKVATIHYAGLLWVKGSWNRGQRFLYMSQCFETLLVGSSTDSLVTEKYFVAPSKFGAGIAVVPIINGLLEMTCAKHKVGFLEIPPPSWRSVLGIKHIKDAKGKRDYKTPTKDLVNRMIKGIPTEIQSNITLKNRATPHDLFDALAISLSLLKQGGYDTIVLANEDVFSPSSLISKFNELAERI